MHSSIHSANNTKVEYVEADALFTACGVVSQPGVPWNLARISSRTPDATVYHYHDTAGAGTCAYIIDTGIDVTHPVRQTY